MKTLEQINTRLIIDSIVSILGMVNTFLVMAGYPVIDLGEDKVTLIVNGLVTLVIFIYTAWKNFPITKDAKTGQQLIQGMKAGEIENIEITANDQTVDILNNEGWEEINETEVEETFNTTNK